MINIYDYTILDNIVNAAPMNDLTRPRGSSRPAMAAPSGWWRPAPGQKWPRSIPKTGKDSLQSTL